MTDDAPRTIPEGPLWFSLIYRWVDTKRGNTGLTLPFLVGALHREGVYSDEDLLDGSALLYLLDAFQRTCPRPYHVEIYKCDYLHEPVAGIYKQLRMDASEASELRDGDQVLYVWTTYSRSQDVGRAAKSFWKKLHGPISERRFTCTGKERYEEFRPKDTAFIDETKNVMAKQI